MVIGNKIVEFEGHWPVIQKVAVLCNSHVTHVRLIILGKKRYPPALTPGSHELCPSSLEIATCSAPSFLPSSISFS